MGRIDLDAERLGGDNTFPLEVVVSNNETDTFETAIEALEAAVNRLEQNDLPLEEALTCFEEGVKAVGRCQDLLNQAELRVEQLVRDTSGQVSVEPFARQGKENGD